MPNLFKKTVAILRGIGTDAYRGFSFLQDVNAFQKVIHLHTAVRIGIFDTLAHGAQTGEALAQALSMNATVLTSLLRSLAHLGYLRIRREQFHLTPFAARYLVKGREEFLGAYLESVMATWEAWKQMPEVVRSGKAADAMRVMGNESDVVFHYYLAANHVIVPAVRELIPMLNLSRIRRALVGEVGLSFVKELLAREPDIEYSIGCFGEQQKFSARLLDAVALPKRPVAYFHSSYEEVAQKSWGTDIADVVFLYRKFGYYPYGERFLARAFEAVPKGGCVIICEPVTDSLLRFIPWTLDAIGMMDHMMGGADAPPLMTSGALQEKVRQAGFARAEVVPTVGGLFQFIVGVK